eukprot:1024869-Karenia_brevis.AAC.1
MFCHCPPDHPLVQVRSRQAHQCQCVRLLPIRDGLPELVPLRRAAQTGKQTVAIAVHNLDTCCDSSSARRECHPLVQLAHEERVEECACNVCCMLWTTIAEQLLDRVFVRSLCTQCGGPGFLILTFPPIFLLPLDVRLHCGLGVEVIPAQLLPRAAVTAGRHTIRLHLDAARAIIERPPGFFKMIPQGFP